MNEQLELFKPLTRTERQKDGLRCWIKNNCKGTLVWATGVGKTNAALMAIKTLLSKNNNLNVLIVVPTDGLQKQWIKNIDIHGLQFNCNVAIINTVSKHQYCCDLLIIDKYLSI